MASTSVYAAPPVPPPMPPASLLSLYRAHAPRRAAVRDASGTNGNIGAATTTTTATAAAMGSADAADEQSTERVTATTTPTTTTTTLLARDEVLGGTNDDEGAGTNDDDDGDDSLRVLSDIVVNIKYARYLPDQRRRETWEEVCARHKAMFVKRFPALRAELEAVYADFIVPKRILPSMRGLQFAGAPIERNNSRIYNCSFVAIDAPEAFAEIMFLLMSGCGVGFSVQRHHIEQLPHVGVARRRVYAHRVADTTEGWADAVKAIMYYYFDLGDFPVFDYELIRPKGAPLSSGGKAPGHTPLQTCLEALDRLMRAYVARACKAAAAAPNGDADADARVPLDALTVHDAVCHISVAVLSGGIRRSALLSLFTLDDTAMRTCKHGAWWEANPQRGRANNSAALYRGEVTKEQWLSLWRDIVDSHCGEPGAYWTNDREMGCNPCCEIGLRSKQYCNLCDVNAATITSQRDFEARCAAAAFVGTLQASFTDFTYMRAEWRTVTESEYLIGVGMTGVASRIVDRLDLRAGAEAVRRTNARVASAIGIRPAARLTTVKPSGTSSTVLQCSSGIHAWHSRFYWRRIQLTKQEALYKYLAARFPDAVEDSVYDRSGDQAVARVPVKAPDGAIVRTEETLRDFLERVRRFNVDWVRAGHNGGANANNVSATITFDEATEADWLGEWLWAQRDTYHGLSVLPRDLGTYTQTPFEECTEAEFEAARRYLRGFDITEVHEDDDHTHLQDQLACAGGACELISSVD